MIDKDTLARKHNAVILRRMFDLRTRITYAVYENGKNYSLIEKIKSYKFSKREIVTDEELIEHINVTRSESINNIAIQDPYIRRAIDDRGLQDRLGKRYFFPTPSVYLPVKKWRGRGNKGIVMYRSPQKIQKY